MGHRNGRRLRAPAEGSNVARLVDVEPNPAMAAWLVARRARIERAMGDAMGPAAPRASGPEAETLRRFRSFTGIALHRGEVRAPALDGLQLNERRMGALLDAWLDAAVAEAGPDGDEVRRRLGPLVEQFRTTLRESASGRSASGKPRAARRTVVAAIDRIAEGFLAVDTVTGNIADANPAAGALLGTPRDALLGVEIDAFLPESERGAWQARLDAMAESGEQVRFETTLVDVSGVPLPVEVGFTAYPTRGRTLALALCRPTASPIERGAARAASPTQPVAPADAGGHGFVRLSDGKPIPRRENGVRRGAGRRNPTDAATPRPTPPR